MSALTVVLLILLVAAVVLAALGWVAFFGSQDQLAEAREQRGRALRQLGESNRIAAVLLTRVPGDTPLAEAASAAIEAQNVGDIDQEWANLNAQADVERFWGEES